MKKVMAILLSALLLVSVFAIPSSATTKADLYAKLKTSVVFKYINIKSQADNAYNLVTITDAQAEQLMPLVDEFLKIVATDKGPTVSSAEKFNEYSPEQTKAVYDLIYRACDIMGWSLTMTKKDSSKQFHPGDYIFYLRDSEGRLIFEYDGDYLTDTSGDVLPAAGQISISNGTYLACGSLFAAASVALYVAFKKKENECA